MISIYKEPLEKLADKIESKIQEMTYDGNNGKRINKSHYNLMHQLKFTVMQMRKNEVIV